MLVAAIAAATSSARSGWRLWESSKRFCLLLTLSLFTLELTVVDATLHARQRSVALVTSVAPLQGSVCGGTLLTIQGEKFIPGLQGNVVMVGSKQCQVTGATATVITCVTAPADSSSLKEVAATAYPDMGANASLQQLGVPIAVFAWGDTPVGASAFTFTYSRASTPVVETFSPVAGHGHDLLTFHGWGLQNAEILVGGQACKIWRKEDSFAQCTLAAAPESMVPVVVSVPGLGDACMAPRAPAPKFHYGLSVLSVRPTESLVRSGSFGGGGPELVIVGKGFSEHDTFVLCEHTGCLLTSPPIFHSAFLHEGDSTYQEMRCQPGALRDMQGPRIVLSPSPAPRLGNFAVELRYEDNGEDEDAPRRTCALKLRAPSGTASDAFAGAWTYTHEATPEIAEVSVEPTAAPAPAVAPAAPGPAPSPSLGQTNSPSPGPAALPAAAPVSLAGALVTVSGNGFTSPSLAGPGIPGQPNVTVSVGSAACMLESISDDEIRCRLPADAALPAPVSVRVRGKGLGVETTVESALLRSPVLTIRPFNMLVAPTVVPDLSAAMTSYASARCRADSVSTDCPPGWECCPNGCKPYCRPSLLQRRGRH